MATIYRKYRPQNFSSLTGQEHIVQTITNEITSNNIAHAYLFSGPRGVGKTTLARLLAKAINCPERQKGASEPCNQCSSCQEINSGRHIDVIEVDAASQTGVDNVRENIIENAQFKPTKGHYKVFIIDEVHMLSISAFNALLKTLEEPPAHVIFILATTELHKLPATIISRCQRFNFKKIPFDHMMERLKSICQEEKISVEEDVLDRIIRKSDGCLRDAESLLGQIFSLNLKKITSADVEAVLPHSNTDATIDFLEKIIEGNISNAIIALNAQAEAGINFDQFAYEVIEVLRTALIIKTTGSDKQFSADYGPATLSKIIKLGDTLSVTRLVQLIDRALKRRLEIKSSPLPQLPLELFAAENAQRDEPPKAEISMPLTSQKNNLPEVIKIDAEKKTDSKQPGVITNTIKQVIAHIKNDEPIKTTFDQINARWNEIVEQISNTNHSLALILKTSTLQKLHGRGLELSVPYSLHHERLNDPKNKKIIEDFLEKKFNERINVSCPNIEKAPSTTSAIDLTNLATEFGGEIVG